MALVELDQISVPQAPEAKCAISTLPNLKGALDGPLTRLTGAIGQSFGAPLSIKPLKKMQYHSELQPQLEAHQAAGHYYDASCLVPELSGEVIDTLIDFTRSRNVNNEASIIIFPCGGAISDAPTDSTSYWGGGRKAKQFWIIIEGKWTPDTESATDAKRDAVVGWVKDLRSALAAFDVSDTAHTLDGNMEDHLSGIAAIYGPNYDKVRKVKAKYDPTNFWRCNRNIVASKPKRSSVTAVTASA